MKFKYILKNVQFKTKYKEAEKAAEELAKELKNSKKFDGTKVFLSKTLPIILQIKGKKWDPYIHSFNFLSNDKDALQKLADHYNKLYYPNHEKDELLGVNVRKNTDNYKDVFEIKENKETTDEKQPVEESANGFKLTEAFEMMRKSGKNLAGIMVEISENLGNVATVAEAIDELGNETDKKTAKSFLNTVFPAALNFEYSQDSSKQWGDENAQRLEAIFAVASSLLQ